jgi:hypothetical protein
MYPVDTTKNLLMLNLVVHKITTVREQYIAFKMYVQFSLICLTVGECFRSHFDVHPVCPMHSTSELRALTMPQSALPSMCTVSLCAAGCIGL